MNKNIHPRALCLIAVLVLGGCGTIKDEKKGDALEAATTRYGEAVRWGYYDSAYGLIHPDKRAPMRKDIENIQVTSYDVVQPPVRKDETTAVQVVRIEYVHKDEQRVYKLSDQQTWRYEAEPNAWRLHSGLPRFE